jgi:polyvinyl alcohol dehydrogenase (cytochrome)
MHQIIRTVVSLVLLASTGDFGFATELSVPAQPEWASAGQNNHNTRYAATEHTINSDNVGSLKPKWTFTTAGDVSATATVVNGVAYVPDWGGKLWAIDTKTGKSGPTTSATTPELPARPRGRARHIGMVNWSSVPETS